jgi:hypothetical protein
VKNFREQALCTVKIFVGYGCQSATPFFAPFPQEQSPFVAMPFIEFCYCDHQLKFITHMVWLSKKVNGL